MLIICTFVGGIPTLLGLTQLNKKQYHEILNCLNNKILGNVNTVKKLDLMG